MKKYFGVIVFILAIILSILLGRIDGSNLNIIKDFNKDQKLQLDAFVPLLIQKIKANLGDHKTQKRILTLSERIKNKPQYSEPERKEIVKLLEFNKISFDKHLPNAALLNLIQPKIHSLYTPNRKDENYNFLINEIVTNRKDSISLEGFMINFVSGEKYLSYLRNGIKIAPSQLKNYNGNLNELEAHLYNPTNGKTDRIK